MPIFFARMHSDQIGMGFMNARYFRNTVKGLALSAVLLAPLSLIGTAGGYAANTEMDDVVIKFSNSIS